MSTADPDLVALWQAVGTRAGADLVALWERLQAAGVTLEELPRPLAARVAALNLHAAATGEGTARAQLTAWGDDGIAPALPLSSAAHALDTGRLDKAVTTILERWDPTDTATAAVVVGGSLHRLARSEAVEAGQLAYGRTMGSSPTVQGWRRQLEGDACELCTWWDRGGKLWPRDHPMPTHKGCDCGQRFERVDASQWRPMSRRGYQRGQERAGIPLEERRQMDPTEYSSRARGRGQR